MRVLAIFVALLFVGSSIQQLNISGQCMFSVLAAVPEFKELNIDSLINNNAYRTKIIATIKNLINVCLPKGLGRAKAQKHLTKLVNLGQQAPQSCLDCIAAMVNIIRQVGVDVMARNFSNLMSHFTSFVNTLDIAKAKCMS